MSQKYKRSKKNRSKAPRKVTFEQQAAEQAKQDKEEAVTKEKENHRKLRESVWEDDFEFTGAL